MDQRLSVERRLVLTGKTTDLLNYAPLPSMAGYKNQAWQNIGSLKNTGVEAAITRRAIQTKDGSGPRHITSLTTQNEITDLEDGVSGNSIC